MTTKYVLKASDTPEALIENTLSEKDDAIAEGHRIADERDTNVAIIQRVESLFAFIRPGRCGPSEVLEHSAHGIQTPADAVKAAFAEGLRTGIASGSGDIANMTLDDVVEYRWRESEAFDFHRALSEVSS